MFWLAVAFLAVGAGVSIVTFSRSNVTAVSGYVALITDATWTVAAFAIVAAAVLIVLDPLDGYRCGASGRLVLVLPLLALLWGEFGILCVLVSSDGLIARILGVAPGNVLGDSSAVGPSVANSVAAVGITLIVAALLATTAVVVARLVGED